MRVKFGPKSIFLYTSLLLVPSSIHLASSCCEYQSEFCEFTGSQDNWNENACEDEYQNTDNDYFYDCPTVEENSKCPSYRNLAWHVPVEDQNECQVITHEGTSKDRTNCLSDNDCPDGAFCCVSLCEGITRCYNPQCMQFVPENNRTSTNPDEVAYCGKLQATTTKSQPSQYNALSTQPTPEPVMYFSKTIPPYQYFHSTTNNPENVSSPTEKTFAEIETTSSNLVAIIT
ncbi:unnamed protein product, partial [Allacma fusca]